MDKQGTKDLREVLCDVSPNEVGKEYLSLSQKDGHPIVKTFDENEDSQYESSNYKYSQQHYSEIRDQNNNIFQKMETVMGDDIDFRRRSHIEAMERKKLQPKQKVLSS